MEKGIELTNGLSFDFKKSVNYYAEKICWKQKRKQKLKG